MHPSTSASRALWPCVEEGAGEALGREVGLAPALGVGLEEPCGSWVLGADREGLREGDVLRDKVGEGVGEGVEAEREGEAEGQGLREGDVLRDNKGVEAEGDGDAEGGRASEGVLPPLAVEESQAATVELTSAALNPHRRSKTVSRNIKRVMQTLIAPYHSVHARWSHAGGR